MKNKNNSKISVFRVFLLTVLVIYVALLFGMFIYSLITSFKDRSDFTWNPMALPNEWHFENYDKILKLLYVQPSVYSPKYYIESLFLHGFIYAAGCTLAYITCSICVAYACARYRHTAAKIIEGMVLVIIAFPIVGSGASEMQVVRQLRLYDSFLGNFILKFSFFNLFFLLLLSAFRSVPKDYREAAMIDGANELYIMIRIIIPMVKNSIGAVALITFIGYWNDAQTPLLYLPSYPTIAYGLLTFSQSTSGPIADAPFKMGAAFIVALPIIILFCCLSDKIMGNISAGGIKG